MLFNEAKLKTYHGYIIIIVNVYVKSCMKIALILSLGKHNSCVF